MGLPSTLPILYSFRRCPYAIRARMALVYNNIQVELREVELKNKPSELLNISPKATVPVLLQPNGRILEESLDIIFWAMSTNKQGGCLDFNSEQQKTADFLIKKNDTDFKTLLDKYKYAQRFPEFPEIHYRKQGELFLKQLNSILTHSPFLIKNKISYVDMALAPFIRQFANVDLDWFQQSKYTYLVQWLTSILNTEVFITTMRKYPVWEPGNDKTVFPI